MFYLTHGPTYKTNILPSIYVEQTFMFNVKCNVYYHKNFLWFVFVNCILSIVWYTADSSYLELAYLE